MKFGWQSHHHQTVAIQVALQGCDLLVIGSYHRGGLDEDIFGEILEITKNGSIPFVWYSDWNASPQKVWDTGWPTQEVRHQNRADHRES